MTEAELQELRFVPKDRQKDVLRCEICGAIVGWYDPMKINRSDITDIRCPDHPMEDDSK